MRNKFTKQAQTALTLAKAAAIDFELGYIGTEHLLLGLLSETEGTAGRVLEEFQVDGKKLVENGSKHVAFSIRIRYNGFCY